MTGWRRVVWVCRVLEKLSAKRSDSLSYFSCAVIGKQHVGGTVRHTRYEGSRKYGNGVSVLTLDLNPFIYHYCSKKHQQSRHCRHISQRLVVRWRMARLLRNQKKSALSAAEISRLSSSFTSNTQMRGLRASKKHMQATGGDKSIRYAMALCRLARRNFLGWRTRVGDSA